MQTLSRSVRVVVVVLCLGGTLQADIYQWEWVNPNDASLGKQESTTLCPGGTGVNAVPSAYLSGRNLTQAYLIDADLTSSTLSSATLVNADLTRAILTNAIDFCINNAIMGRVRNQEDMSDAPRRIACRAGTAASSRRGSGRAWMLFE